MDATRDLGQNVQQNVNSILYDDNTMVGKLFGKASETFRVPREQIAYVLGSILGIYLVIGKSAQLACNLIGFVYPAYQSMKAIRSVQKDDDTQWLTYWTVFAVFSLIDFGADVICGWFPLYWLAKCVFLLYLFLPFTMGAEKLWTQTLNPLFEKYEGKIDASASEIKGHSKEFAANQAAAAMQTEQGQQAALMAMQSMDPNMQATPPPDTVPMQAF